MRRHLLIWKPVRFNSRAGRVFWAEVPRFIERNYNGTLLSQILAMPPKRPISFDDAVRLAGYKSFDADVFGYAPGESEWYFKHFVEWISDLGYHIEVTGDEFAAPVNFSQLN